VAIPGAKAYLARVESIVASVAALLYYQIVEAVAGLYGGEGSVLLLSTAAGRQQTARSLALC
jgi:hypothetical protein